MGFRSSHISAPALFAALALLAVAASPAAVAEAPPSQAWSPATLPAQVSDLAIAREGDAVLAGTADPDANDPGDSDLHFLSVSSGVDSAFGDATVFTEGTSAVAVSPGGEAMAAGATGTEDQNLFYFTAESAPATAWRAQLAMGVTGLDLSGDGGYLAVSAAGVGSTGAMYLYDGDGQLLTSHQNEGRLNAVAVSSDGRWVVAAGSVQDGDVRKAVVHLYSRSQGGHPVFTETIEEGASGEALSVAMTPDARYFVAGTAAGRLYSFHRSASAVSGPHVLELGATRVTGVAISSDGDTVVAGDAGGVHLMKREGTSSILRRAWNHTTAGAVTDVDLSDDGQYALAAVPGAGGAALAFHERRAEPIWSLSGGANHVALTHNASHAVVATGAGVSAVALHHAVEMGFSGPGGTVVESSEIQRVRPYEAATYELVVQNKGSVRDVFGFEFPVGSGWDIRASPATLDLLPEESARVTLAATPLQQAQPGTHALRAVVRSQHHPVTSDEVGFSVSVRATTGVAVQLQGSHDTRRAEAGEVAEALFRVANHGNQWVNVTAEATQAVSEGPRWDVTIDGPARQLGPGSATSVLVRVAVPASAPDGALNAITLRVTGGEASDAATAVYVVNPYQGVALSSDATAKFVNATRPAVFNLTVTNTGSVTTEYRFTYEREEFGTSGWTVDLNVLPFSLDKGASRTVEAVIHPPHNGEVGDHVVVQVTAMPVEEFPQLYPVHHANVTIAANYHQFPEDPETLGERLRGLDVPLPGAALAALALAAAALAAGRRWRL